MDVEELKDRVKSVERTNRSLFISNVLLNRQRKELQRKYDELEKTVEFLKHTTDEDDTANDIILVSSDGSNVRANKTILSSRSPVFRAMLQTDMEEKKTGVVKMTDVSCNVLESFVRYLYTAEAPSDLDDNLARELFVLGDKYQVDRLKSFCDDFLASKVTKENAISGYVFSHHNNAKRLKLASIALISQDMEELPKCEEYHTLSLTNPHVLLGLYEAHFATKLPRK